MLVDIRERYKFLRHVDRLLLWQIEQVERDKQNVNRAIRIAHRRYLRQEAVRRVIDSARDFVKKVVDNGGRL